MKFSTVYTKELPDNPSPENVYILEPIEKPENYYTDRTNRNIGWITNEEQNILKNTTIGIAGCGGMGGLVAQILLRAGVGTIKIADTEVFDTSNINRQFGATYKTIGHNKAFATATLLRETTDDTTIHVYPKGITEEYVDDFVNGCDLILDEIEYWALSGRIMLHQKAMSLGIHIINANTVGFGSRLFLFTPNSATIEDCLGINYKEAIIFDKKLESGTARIEERIKAMAAVTLGLVPEYLFYSPKHEKCGNMKSVAKRLAEEGKAPIFATNPPMCSGFLADHVALYLLRNSGVIRKTIKLPIAPGYLLFDAAKMKAKVRKPNSLRNFINKLKIKAVTFFILKKIKGKNLEF